MTTVAVPTAGVFVLQDQEADFSAFVTRLLALAGYQSAGYSPDFTTVFVHFEDSTTQATANAAVQSAVDAHVANALYERMLERMAEVNTLRDSWMSGHFLYDGHRWDCDEKGMKNIEGTNTAAILLAAAGQSLPADFVFRDRDNNNVPANAAYMSGMGLALFKFRSDSYVASWIHKYMISQCTTLQAVTDYDITAGWPARG